MRNRLKLVLDSFLWHFSQFNRLRTFFYHRSLSIVQSNWNIELNFFPNNKCKHRQMSLVPFNAFYIATKFSAFSGMAYSLSIHWVSILCTILWEHLLILIDSFIVFILRNNRKYSFHKMYKRLSDVKRLDSNSFFFNWYG